MNKTLFWPGLLMALAVGNPTPVPAATDGYYCVGRDYLAYQFNQPAGSARQTLTLLRLDGQQGVTETRHYEIEAFPVFGIRCLSDAVDLLAGDRIHRVPLTDQARPASGAVEPQPEDSLLPDFTSDSLAGDAAANRTLPLTAVGGHFILVIEPSPTDPKSAERGFLRHQTANGEIREYPLLPAPTTTIHE